MWVVQGATQRFVRNKSHGVRDKTLGLILHVQAGNGELTGWFNNPGSEASSAWQAMKSGVVFQFGDPDADKFWTQSAGNPDYGAVESEGYPSEPLTDAQIDGIARIYADGHIHEGWPFQLAEKPGDRGLGWHGMGGVAWGNHPNCPGDIRKAQRKTILARAQQLVGGGEKEWFELPLDIQTKQDITDAVVAALKTDGLVASPAKSNPTVAPVTGIANAGAWALQARNEAQALRAQVTTLTAAVQALAESKGGDAAAITAAVVAKINALQLTITTNEETS